jgi:hypothetical protein
LDNPIVAPIIFKGSTDLTTNKPLTETITEVNKTVADLKTALEAPSKNPIVNTLFQSSTDGTDSKTFDKGIEWVKDKINQLVKNPTKSTHEVIVTGVMDLQAAIDKHSQLDGVRTTSYHTVYVNTVEGGGGEDSSEGERTGGYISSRVGGFIQKLRSGGAFSGKLPGYGGGDIVNAKLEPGEFVLRKEAVKQIGVNALRSLNNLNSPGQKSLSPQSGTSSSESLFSGQLHTINLNIGNVVHTVYGESNVLNQLTSSMRRARLMTA